MIQFDRKISIDGVAVIIAAASVIIWLTTLQNTVSQNKQQLANHEQRIDEIQKTQAQLSQNLAVLTAIQQERVTK